MRASISDDYCTRRAGYIAAERVYREGLRHAGPNATLFYNLGILLEDLDRIAPAIEAYQHAVAVDPGLADGHYNLARLFEMTGKPQHAIRHLGEYKSLKAGFRH